MLGLKRGDTDAFFGTFFDAFPKVLTGVIVLTPLFGRELLFGKLLPSIALGFLLSGLYFSLTAVRLQRKTRDKSIAALPGGVNAGRFFIWLFAIMLPVYHVTHDPIVTLFVGIGANILSSIVSIFLAFFGKWIIKIIPREALFGALAGGALTWLTLSSFNSLLKTPFLGMLALFIVLAVYLAHIKTPLAPPVLSIIACIIAGIFLKVITMTSIKEGFENFGFYIPGAIFSTKGYFALIGEGVQRAVAFLPIILAFSIGETISNLQGIEQAADCGDHYNERSVLLGVNIVSLLSAFLGNPFCIGVWWGYPSWKERKAGAGYPILVGAFYVLLTMSGLIGIVTAFIPLAAVIPILMFIGLISFQGAFTGVKPKFIGLMALAASLPILEWGVKTGANLPWIAKGSILTALLWSSALYFIMTKEHKKVVITLLVAALIAFTGLIHSEHFILVTQMQSGHFRGFSIEPQYKNALYYVILAALYGALAACHLIRYEEETS